jgi:hypothetical protein
LPDNLTNGLQVLKCGEISIYPNLVTFSTIEDKILYIQKVNTEIGVEKCKQWLDIVDKNKIFLEKYMMKRCHPNNLKIEEMDDLDTYINKLIDNL